MSIAINARIEVPGFSVTADFAVDRGITVLYGPSGAGKSLTLAALAGLIRPSEGSIVLNGTVADRAGDIHVPSQRRRIGMAFQQAALLPHRNVRDNVALVVRGLARSEQRRRAEELLDLVGASHLGSADPATLSGGERQRVGLARALAGDISLLLLDEPLTALDSATKHAMHSVIRNAVEDRGLIALVVTHDIADVIALADTVVLTAHGRTVSTHHLDGMSAVEVVTLLTT